MRSAVSKENVITDYQSGRSLRDVAHKYNISAATAMRIVRAAGKLRGKDEAQKLALENGTSVHPTEGTQRSEEVKNKISAAMAESWDGLSQEEKDRRAKVSQERWNQMSVDKRQEISKKAMKAIRKAADDGSKLEHFVQKTLTEHGFGVIPHKKELIPNTKLEVDILVPELKTVIEIDGPSHFMPVWGEETLQKTQRSDADKNGLLLTYGFKVIRIRYAGKNFTRNLQNNTATELLSLLNKIKSNQPVDNITYVEVS